MVIVLCSCAPPPDVAAHDEGAGASSSPPQGVSSEDPIRRLDTALKTLSSGDYTAARAWPSSPEDPVALPPEEAGGNAAETIAEDLVELRRDVQRLQETLDVCLDSYVYDLREENLRLRKELARLRALQAVGSTASAPQVPMPGDYDEEDIPEIPAVEEPVEAVAPSSAAASLSYTVVKEWGRTPEEAKRFQPPASSLKGMVCVVPQGASDRELAALGRRFREEFDGFDNINIDVFDNREAAEAYVEHNRASPDHLVLSVSKFSRSGQDAILLFRGRTAIDVPRRP